MGLGIDPNKIIDSLSSKVAGSVEESELLNRAAVALERAADALERVADVLEKNYVWDNIGDED